MNVRKHLQEDIKESKHSIAKDKRLLKEMKKTSAHEKHETKKYEAKEHVDHHAQAMHHMKMAHHHMKKHGTKKK